MKGGPGTLSLLVKRDRRSLLECLAVMTSVMTSSSNRTALPVKAGETLVPEIRAEPLILP